ncbi:hypothetical protein DFR29_10461 [Tahibacter aquaticus]|uniref:TIGR03016 family PEP-CTERM system-associated outer membrane protein n=1 Tax=Tahibacter aquaticus TaxID=520092 RepID=A0A4R6Z236_9GAMM|nr:hypothetical protein [Tahibacter aquaticus]TDR45633.1 hypothetical protein DFR29_10461 [Tahibacter aquaticus]
MTLTYLGHATWDPPAGASRERQGLYAMLKLDQTLGAYDVRAKVSVNRNPEADAQVYNDRLYLDEWYVHRAFGALDLTVGRQPVRGGRATLVNPTDYFDQRDYRDALLSTDRVRATDAVRAVVFAGSYQWSAVYAPRHTKSLMPNTDSRWFFQLPQTVDAEGASVPLTYTWIDYTGSHTDGSRPQVLLKLDREAQGFSYAVSYFDGEDNLPAFEARDPEPTPGGLLVGIDQLYPDKRALGIDTEVLLGKAVLRAEATRVDLSYADGTRDRYDHLVAGIDLNVEHGLFGEETYFALEYSKQFARDGQRYGKEDLRHILSDALLARVEVSWGTRDSVTTDVVFDTRRRQSAVMLEWRHELSDRLTLHVSGDLLSGRSDTFFGQYTRNDRLGLRLEYTL